MNSHCVKSAQIRSYFWPLFFSTRTEYKKIRTRNNSVFGHFSRSAHQSELKQRLASVHKVTYITAIADKKKIGLFCVSGVLCSLPQSAVQSSFK